MARRVHDVEELLQVARARQHVVVEHEHVPRLRPRREESRKGLGSGAGGSDGRRGDGATGRSGEGAWGTLAASAS